MAQCQLLVAATAASGVIGLTLQALIKHFMIAGQPTRKRMLLAERKWPSRLSQLSELLTQDRLVRKCPLSDGSRVMKFAEGAPALGQKQALVLVCFLAT